MLWNCLLILASLATAFAKNYRGFNYAAQNANYSTFEHQFNVARSIFGDGYSSARLYTMVEDGTNNDLISAIPAAMSTNTTLLLGLWASEDQDKFNRQLQALETAIDTYKDQGFGDRVVGISVGSEDLYRASSAGIARNEPRGQDLDTLVGYIYQVRAVVAGTCLQDTPIGHVDTLDAFRDPTNKAVVESIDFLGLDSYPYFGGVNVDDATQSFWESYRELQRVAAAKPVWITETGWPIEGATSYNAVPSLDNAAQFWKSLACELEDSDINFWWYILAGPANPLSFDVVDLSSSTSTSSAKPLFDITCQTNSTHSYTSVSDATVQTTLTFAPSSSVKAMSTAPSCN